MALEMFGLQIAGVVMTIAGVGLIAMDDGPPIRGFFLLILGIFLMVCIAFR